jgi:hypothetical protein
MCNLSAKPIILAVVLVGVQLVQGCNRSTALQQNTNQGGGAQAFADAQTAATQSLATFRKLVTSENYKELGFESADQVANARLGAPLQIFIVKLDQLREYQTGSDPNRLLNEGAQLYYPVAVGEQTRSSLVVEQSEGKWKAASFGNAGLAKQIAVVSKRATAPQTTVSSEFIVQVPALGIYFLGHRADNKLMLTPLATDPGYDLKAGATQPAEEIFTKLAPFAKSHNGLPM